MSIKLNHITKIDRQNVYPPSEDTFLMIDSLIADSDNISSLNPCMIMEIGVGSGAILGSMALFLHLNSVFIGVDINKFAVKLSQSTFLHNNCKNTELINTNAFGNLNILNKIDVIICNPPYVPTSTEEYLESQKKKNIDSSFAGGQHGREFIDELLNFSSKVLSEQGVLYLLIEEQNGVFFGTKIREQRRGCENLSIIRMTRSEVFQNLVGLLKNPNN